MASSTGTVNLVSAARVRAAAVPVAAARDRLRTAVEKLEQRGLAPRPRDADRAGKFCCHGSTRILAAGKIDRAWDTACLLQKMATREEARAHAILDGQAAIFRAALCDGPLENLVFSGLSARGATQTGRRSAGRFSSPVWAFRPSQKRHREAPRIRLQIIQVEFGPNSVLPRG